MDVLNVEIKASSQNHKVIREYLTKHNARVVGCDHQVDTYFNTTNGRLKLREGSIEKNLIFYNRSNQAGPKESFVKLFTSENLSEIKDVLVASNGIKVVVDKQREIFFLDNVKFHLDTVKELGTFIEIEAIDKELNIGKEKLLEQCQYFMNEFDINEVDLIDCSYSDLLIQK